MRKIYPQISQIGADFFSQLISTEHFRDTTYSPAHKTIHDSDF